jgi:hypothetical protein
VLPAIKDDEFVLIIENIKSKQKRKVLLRAKELSKSKFKKIILKNHFNEDFFVLYKNTTFPPTLFQLVSKNK